MTDDSPAKRLQWARENHNQYAKPTEAAKAFGWTVSTYLGHENGDRNPSIAAIKRYARAYRVRWEWLLTGEGSPTPNEATAPVVGQVSGNGEIHFYPEQNKKDTVELPPGGTLSTVALVVSGATMRGLADDRWLIFFDHVRQPPTPDLIGKLCIVETADGQVLLRELHPGGRKARYNLESPMSPTLRDRRVVWAAQVTWIKPR